MNYGIDFFLSDKTSLNLLGEWESGIGITKDFMSENSTYNDGFLKDSINTGQYGKSKYSNQFSSVYFKHKFAKEGNELTAELNYYVQSNNIINRYTDYYFLSEYKISKDTIKRNDYSDNLQKTLELKSDYTFIIKNIKGETGIRISENRMDNR